METGKVIGIGLLSVLVFSFWASILYGTYIRYENQFVFTQDDYGVVDRIIINKQGAFKLSVESTDLNDSEYAIIDVKHFVFAMYSREFVQPNITATGVVEGSNLRINISGDLGYYSNSEYGINGLMSESLVMVKINRNLPIQLEIVNSVGDLKINLSNQIIESIIMSEEVVGTFSIYLETANITKIDCGGSIVGDLNIQMKNSTIRDIILTKIVGDLRFYTEESSFGYLNYSIVGESRVELKNLKLNMPATIEIHGTRDQHIRIEQYVSPIYNFTVITRDITGDVHINAELNYSVVNLIVRPEVETGDFHNGLNLPFANNQYMNQGYNSENPSILLDLHIDVGNIRLN